MKTSLLLFLIAALFAALSVFAEPVFNDMQAQGTNSFVTNGYSVTLSNGVYRMADPESRIWLYDTNRCLHFVDCKGGMVVCSTSTMLPWMNRRSFTGFPTGFVSSLTNYPTNSADPGASGQVAVDGTNLFWCIQTNNWIRLVGGFSPQP